MNDNLEKDGENNEKTPVNEIGGFYFSTAIKIFDPNSDEILVQQRGDI